jgi:hypothetical protein
MTDKKKHLFQKGTSGNPAGRPKGSVNKYTELSRELLSENGVLIVSKVIEKAMDGDVACLKMCMDRIIPAHKAVEIKHENQDMAINIVVESITSAATKQLSQSGYTVLDTVVGEIEEEEIEEGNF